MTKSRTIIEDAEYPVFDASGQPYDWFLDGIAEWEKKGCPKDGLGVAIGKHMHKAARHGTLPPPELPRRGIRL